MTGSKKRMRDTCAIAFLSLGIALAAVFNCFAMADGEPSSLSPPSAAPGQIYLYGEAHGNETMSEQEYDMWYEYYHNENMRHLFIEAPYYAAEFYNMWMQADGDEIFDALYADLKGTHADNPYSKKLFYQIKQECPQTIFHGTDVGHQHGTMGERYLEYLRTNGLEDTKQYLRAQEIMKQGIEFEKESDSGYRENMLAQNFIYEFDKLNGESVLGIYGSGHVSFYTKDPSNTVTRMAGQLLENYGDSVHILSKRQR